MSDRFIPSISRLQEAASELPPAGSWREETYAVPLGSRSITFRRIKFRVSGGMEFRWIYEGKVRMHDSSADKET